MAAATNFSSLLMLNPLFAALGTAAVEKIAALGSRVTLSPGEVLFEKGNVADALYAIRRGDIRIERGSAAGRRMSLTLLSTGDVFGEMGLLDGKPRSADARAVTAAELFQIKRRDFLALLEREPKFAIQLIELLCDRLRALNDRMEETLLLPLPNRIARCLMALAQDFGAEIDATQEELANYVGAARETVSRQLQLWRRDGTLEMRRGKIRILDPRKLKAHGRR
jgi:CRP-like cAMP-binding protein